MAPKVGAWPSVQKCVSWEKVLDETLDDPMTAMESTPLTEDEEQAVPPIQSFKSNERLFRQRGALVTVIGVLGAVLVVCGGSGLLNAALSGEDTIPLEDSPVLQRWSAVAPCDFAATTSCPASSLLDMRDVHEAAKWNILGLGQRLGLPQSPVAVEAAVRACFENVSVQLERHAPQVMRELETVRFTRAQVDATMNSLRLLGDSHVESLGLDVAEAIRDSGIAATDDGQAAVDDGQAPARLTRLLDDLEPGEISAKLHTAPLLWGEGRQWHLTLDSETLHSASSVSDDWRAFIGEAERPGHMQLDAARMAAGEEAAALAVVAGVLEQVRVMLDIIRVRTRTRVPARVTSTSAYLGVHADDVSCGVGPAEGSLNRFACPLKFGIVGMDAMRAFYGQLREDRYMPPRANVSADVHALGEQPGRGSGEATRKRVSVPAA